MYEAAKVYCDEGRYADAERCETQAMNATRQLARRQLFWEARMGLAQDPHRVC
jgi:tRNA A37 N6-isopentenylltransferase MiaA